MSDSLRDQLIKAGFKPAARSKPGRKGKPVPGKGKGKGGSNGPNRSSRRRNDGGDISLAAAYAAKRKAEHRDHELHKAEKMRLDAERKRQNDQLQALLEGKSLNDSSAEIPRHFQDGGRITRIYVTEDQQQGLADGRLGIVKLRRRYWLVEASIAGRAAKIKPDAVIDLSSEAED